MGKVPGGSKKLPIIPVAQRVGAFRYIAADGRWEWSEAVAAMHGYPQGQVQPTTELVMSHKHPDDAPAVAALIDRMITQGEPFSSRHRIIDTAGRVHVVLVVGDRLTDNDGAVIGTGGFYVDTTDLDEEASLKEAVAEFAAHRTAIEQAKGMLMVTYQISAEHAFEILSWRSQETNVKLRDLAEQVVADFGRELGVDSGRRERADHVLMTIHKRITG